ncbi:MAG: substrate-binding protein [Paenibacillus sp.]|nr:substrate-binding protein [Paenibacillus sp.]
MNFEEIAKLAGVSKATVSRVVHNSTTVSADTRKKVLHVIKELNVDVNIMKRKKESASSQIVGLLLPLNQNRFAPFLMDIMVGAERKVLENDYMMLMSGISEDTSRNDHILDKMAEKEVEGMIVFPSENIAAKSLEELQDKGIPFVCVDQILTGIEADQVHADNVKGSVVLMKHLHELGHRRIAIMYHKELFSLRERLRGCQLSMLEHGIPLEEALFINTPELKNSNAIYLQVLNLLQGPDRPTAMVLTSPHYAVGVIRALNELDLRVPEHISLVTFDDHYAALPAEYQQFFTAVVQNAQQIGRLAAEQLFHRIQNPDQPVQEILLPGTLNVRQSTAPPRSLG